MINSITEGLRHLIFEFVQNRRGGYSAEGRPCYFRTENAAVGWPTAAMTMTGVFQKKKSESSEGNKQAMPSMPTLNFKKL